MNNIINSPYFPKLLPLPFLIIISLYLIIWGWKQYKYGVMHLMIQQIIGLLIIRKFQGREKELKKYSELSQPAEIKSQGRTMLLGGIFLIGMVIYQLSRLAPILVEGNHAPLRIVQEKPDILIFPIASIYSIFIGWFLIQYKKLLFFLPLEVYLLTIAIFQGPEVENRKREYWNSPYHSKKNGKGIIILGIICMILAVIDYVQ